ncbi:MULTISPECIES: EutN/CcmL family microcompartment protein [Clostridia]|uniref:EutN/CcmL family microcompartment protein n=1 Tax=Clostridia TaxID=186801 RepID=UPI000EA0A7D6|nr:MULTISPECIES: EutN/CcmL family microcompartment protein [Clostridia]NBJ68051.1 ethanolamine utilization protein EutN [Roseburia sp. 1XD42-34]RKI82492.1 ethanolamine utilization protein EutN [Clostridium sp. 1xD42-85]
MQIGKVAGNVVSTKKVDSLTGYKLMIVDLIRIPSKKVYQEVIAIDKVGAGKGEYVLVTLGSAARNITKSSDAIVDAAIVGIIDTFDE